MGNATVASTWPSLARQKPPPHSANVRATSSMSDGLVPAMWVGVGVLSIGALIALVLPFSTRAAAAEHAAYEAEPAGELAAVAA